MTWHGVLVTTDPRVAGCRDITLCSISSPRILWTREQRSTDRGTSRTGRNRPEDVVSAPCDLAQSRDRALDVATHEALGLVGLPCRGCLQDLVMLIGFFAPCRPLFPEHADDRERREILQVVERSHDERILALGVHDAMEPAIRHRQHR